MSASTLERAKGGVTFIEVCILVAIATILLALFLPRMTGYDPHAAFIEKCVSAGGVPVVEGRPWLCYAPGILIPIK